MFKMKRVYKASNGEILNLMGGRRRLWRAMTRRRDRLVVHWLRHPRVQKMKRTREEGKQWITWGRLLRVWDVINVWRWSDWLRIGRAGGPLQVSQTKNDSHWCLYQSTGCASVSRLYNYHFVKFVLSLLFLTWVFVCGQRQSTYLCGSNQ